MSKRLWFWLILLGGIGVRLYCITSPLLDAHAWRQADTASMAVNFLQRGFFPMIPQLNYDGPPPNYVELEFPFSPLIIALIWKLTGQFDWLARLIEVFFSTLTIVVIYCLGKELYDRTSGLIAMAFFAFNPLAIYFGRTVMPESSMLLFMTSTVLFLVLWHKSPKTRWLLLSAVSFALAVLAKLPSLMIAVPLATIVISKYKVNFLKAKQTWLFVIVGLLPPIIYYLLAHQYAGAKYVSGIIQSQTALQPGYEYLFRRIEKLVTWPLLVPGLLAPFIRKSSVGNSFLWSWAGTLALYTLTVCAKIQLEYYLLPLIPLLCILTGATLGKFWGEAPGVLSTLLILGTMANIAHDKLPIYYQVDYNYLHQAEKIKKTTGPGDLLILSDGPPMTFYYSDRKGWRLLPDNQTPEELEKLHAKGAAVFVILPGSQVNQKLASYLGQNYQQVSEGNFYDLRKPLH